MWADKSNPKLRRCRQRISPFFFYLSLFLSVFCSSTSTFFPCRHLFFFSPSRSRVHACTPTPVACLHSEACVRPHRKAPAAPLPTSFCSRWGSFLPIFLHRSRSEEIRTSGSESREFYAHGFRVCSCGVTVGGI